MSDLITTSSNRVDNDIIENCIQINELDATVTRGGYNGLLKDAPDNVSTSIVNGLSQQLIYQINLIVPDTLVSFDDLNVDLADAAFPFLQPPAKVALQRGIQARVQMKKLQRMAFMWWEEKRKKP